MQPMVRVRKVRLESHADNRKFAKMRRRRVRRWLASLEFATFELQEVKLATR